jgi:Flp pilus assembly protein TadG
MRAPNGPMKWTPTPGTLSTYSESGDISNASLFSAPFLLTHLDAYSIQLVTTGGTVTGTFKLQASNSDPLMPPGGIVDATAMTWTDIDGSPVTVTTAGTVVWNASGVGYRWVRVVWTESGTASGAVTGRENGKGAH